MNAEFNTELLISLVEYRPILWDKAHIFYKDKTGAKKAWREVCTELNSDFAKLQDEDKNRFIKEVMKKWSSVRDNFLQFCKKENENKQNYAGGSIKRKYVYGDQLKFLKTFFTSRDLEDNIAKDGGREKVYTSRDVETNIAKDEDRKKLYTSRDVEANIAKDEDREKDRSETEGDIDTQIATKAQTRSAGQNLGCPTKKRQKSETSELKALKATEDAQRNRISYFMNSVMPTLEKFDEHEVLKFQTGVLHQITQIHEQRRRCSNPPSDPQPATSTQPQICVLPPQNFQYYQNFGYPTSSNSIVMLNRPMETNPIYFIP
ncbi:uncharacterized protein LOC126839753 [Adelges cooleyi]|uniref:uncharacterized protein LOC126839753 n=1 Tax=Adelges cooleyi TaxID=133065 RepID=UPI00217F7539|nr:uncharacterized protein LOC126839753 [Adelges cooleyi]